MANFHGTLAISGSNCFINRDEGGNQVVMMMRNRPPGGSLAEKMAAATSLFVTVLGLTAGSPISVDGDLVPLGDQQALAVDDARRG